MKKFIIFLSIFFVSPLPLLAQVYITEVLPNTDDDAIMEYIDISNSGCEPVDISGYQIADKEKSYTFAAGSTLGGHETYRLGRPTSKIVLNNSNEELSLHDTAGVLVHTFAYATSGKGVAITVPGIILDDCEVADPDEDTGVEEEDNNSEGDTTPDTTTQEDTLEGDEAENTTMDNDDEIGETGSGSTDDTGTGNTIGDTEEGTSTSSLDEDGEDIAQNEHLEIQDDESETDSGATDGGSGDSSAGQVDEDIESEDIQISNLLGKSGSLAPQILLYSDSDGDGRIDILEVLYDVYITGSIDTSRILIYSNTGGLYEHRVNTETGYILDAEIEDNILRLFLEPSYYEKVTLIHNTTTQSDIRLKSSGGFGITSLSGIIVEDFLLTSSFDAYKEVYEKSEYESLGTEDVSEEDEIGSGTTVITFPEIVPTIQNYTNTTLSGQTFICRETPCRLNLNFESVFDSAYPSSSYSCRITYNGVVEDKCNPSQWSPTSAGGFEVRIIYKATGQYKSQYFHIDWNIITNQATTAPSTHDRSAPIPRITLNGTLTKKQIQKDNNHIYCYTNTCSLNFDGSDTYDPDGSTMTYSWSLSGKVFATKKNPTIQEFGIGEHIIEFTATDSSGKSSTEHYRVSVVGDMTLPPDTEIAIASDISDKESKKKQAINFFSPPELIVEKSSAGFSKQNNGYRCVTTNASCSANFALTGTVDRLYYRFSYSHEGAPLWSTNPRSKSFQAGKYTLMLSAHYEKGGESIWQQSIPIEILRVKKVKVEKTSTPKTKTASVVKSSNTIDIIPTAYADDGGVGSSDSGLVFSILFFSLLLNGFFLTRRKVNNV